MFEGTLVASENGTHILIRSAPAASIILGFVLAGLLACVGLIVVLFGGESILGLFFLMGGSVFFGLGYVLSLETMKSIILKILGQLSDELMTLSLSAHADAISE